MIARLHWLAAVLLSAAMPGPAAAQKPGVAADAKAGLVLTGTITGADHQSFVQRNFPVPAGVHTVTVTFSYDRSGGTVIDLGLFDDERFRGWSGGNKARFKVGVAVATPSYLAGPVAGRQFSLLLGVPNARAGSSAQWRAEIGFERVNSPAMAASQPLRTGATWYRGDLHSHSGHSDGSCANDVGTRIPCPLYRSVEAAARAGLDFLALTEHNTISHLTEVAALQPAFARLLLIPGQEVTTFFGHANVLGPTRLAEFRVGTREVPGGTAWARAIAGLGGIVSINHPGLPSGESCMGCGWTMRATDWSGVDAIEIVNGGALAAAGGQIESPLSGIPFWEQRLSEGHRLAPIAGSDNHDAALKRPDPRAIGTLATVVWADNLSVDAITAAIRRGRVFVDADSSPGRVLDLIAYSPKGAVMMGGTLPISPGGAVELRVRVAGCAGCSVGLVQNGRRLAPLPVQGVEETIALPFVASTPGWVRADVRDGKGRLTMIGNAIRIGRP